MLEALADAGATHLIGIPDNDSAALYDRAARDTRLRVLTVTREGEAFAVAAGLWIGGASPVVAIQNTGLLESGDSLRGTAMRMGVPLLCLIGYRGHARAGHPRRDLHAAVLQRAEHDSAAVLTEPTLKAWRVPFGELEGGAEAAAVNDAWRLALERETPVALLIRGKLVAGAGP